MWTACVVHVDTEEAQARRIEDTLREAGVEVWRTGHVEVGQSVIEALGRRLVDGTNVVVCLSARAVGTGLIRRVANEAGGLFAERPPVKPSAHLLETLRSNVRLASTIGTEKARSELIIAPHAPRHQG